MTEATAHTTERSRIAPPSALLQLLELRATREHAAGVARQQWGSTCWPLRILFPRSFTDTLFQMLR